MTYTQIVFSPTGGTKKIADALMNQLAALSKTIDLSDASFDFEKIEFTSEDIILIAMPVFGGRIPAPAIERISKIKGNFAKCIIVCTYGNRAYEDALVEMQDTAQKCGFNVIAAITAVAEHSIIHQYAAKRPDEEDFMKLQKFAEKIKEEAITDSKTELKLPGNRPYRKISGGGLVPKATTECVKCGLCAKRCPTNAINPINLNNADSKKCISCMRCVSECPHNARKVNAVMVSVAASAIKKACSDRKNYELFI